MLIVFEGPDGAGKTTLAEEVAKRLNYNLRGKITRVGPDLIEHSNSEDFKRDGNWILDRCYWVSDYIYEPYVNGLHSILEFKNFSKLAGSNIKYIYITCEENALRERIISRGDELWNADQIVQIKQRYDNFFTNEFPQPVLCVNTKFDFEQNVQAIINYIKGGATCK